MSVRSLLACFLFLLGTLSVAPGFAQDLDFVANHRQWPAEVRYRAAIPGGAVFLTNSGFVYSYYNTAQVAAIHERTHHPASEPGSSGSEPVSGHAYRVRFVGSSASAWMQPSAQRTTYYNYFLGADSSHWAAQVPAYGTVSYRGVYPKVDLDVYSQASGLKYDFIIAPGGDPANIRLRFEGVAPSLTSTGDLRIRTSVTEILEQAPVAYQIAGGRRRAVRCRYRLQGQTLSFDFPDGYDRGKPLVIDPLLIFATYSGATSVTFGWSATGDTSGNVYSAGQSFAPGWPVTTGAFQTTFGALADIGINKYNAAGTSLLYATYFGGDSLDCPNTMIVNRSNELVMAGATLSPNLALTSGCYDNTHNGASDIYVARFNAGGTALLGATFLGGSGREGDISTSLGNTANRGELMTDASGSIYLAFATSSTNFPTSTGAFQRSLRGGLDAFVAKLNADCSSLLFSSFLGGSANDAAVCMQLTPSGKLVVGGGTTSTDFPGASAGWQPLDSGSTDGFIAILDTSAAAVLHATYLGTTGTDEVAKLQLDEVGNVYATGISSAGHFPVSSNVYVTPRALDFIIKLDSTLSTRLLSTTFGGPGLLWPTAFMVDKCGNLYFVGYGGGSASLVTTPDALQATPGSFWMAALNPGMASLRYASFMGAIGDHIDGGSSRLDPAGVIYHAVCTQANAMPTSPASWSPTRKTGGLDVAAWKFAYGFSGMTAGMDIGADSICAPATVHFRNTSLGAASYSWDFGDGSGSSLHSPPPHLYSTPGRYRIRLYTFNSLACKPVDSVIRTIEVFGRDTVALDPDVLRLCGRDSIRIRVKPEWRVSVVPDRDVLYVGQGGSELLFYPQLPTLYTIIAANPGYCHVPAADTLQVTLLRDTTEIRRASPVPDFELCNRDTAVYRFTDLPMRYAFIPAAHTSRSADGRTIRFYPPASTSYTLVSSSFNSCDTLHDTMSFAVRKARVDAAFDLSPKLTDQHDPVFRTANRSSFANSYEWLLNDRFWSIQANPELRPPDTGTYCLTLLAKNEFCTDTAEECARLIQTYIDMPNAFTPNGDSKNDLFRPFSRNARILEFSVYNRYGQRVFVSFEDREGWDGTFKGRDCDVGTYFYQLRYQILNREPQLMKGDVSLIR